MSDEWRCPRCGSARWVPAALSPGARQFRQCVPCGYYDYDADVPRGVTVEGD